MGGTGQGKNLAGGPDIGAGRTFDLVDTVDTGHGFGCLQHEAPSGLQELMVEKSGNPVVQHDMTWFLLISS